MPLSKDRATPLRDLQLVGDPVAAATTIYAGALVCVNAAGNAVPGSTATGLKARGIATHPVINTGAAGAATVQSRKGCARLKNDGSVTRAHIEATAYIVDDETVAATDGSGTRSAAGRIVDVESAGVWVEIK